MVTLLGEAHVRKRVMDFQLILPRGFSERVGRITVAIFLIAKSPFVTFF